MPSPVESDCDAFTTPLQTGSTVLSGQTGHAQQVCVRIVLLPSNVWQQFFGRSAFLSEQETDLPPAAVVRLFLFADRTIYIVFCRRRT
ncbi:hypothetical protein TNCV_3088211 [Trichonephila clavipes]|uniref:Uncharacterized protein n=1 Tax=Trichonephila clavipes TaxID=2585209 RepID=A0A8X6V4C9_TRICX|nr:hypothetical protein TNCV_3088211 [Trichonephila clavipes]